MSCPHQMTRRAFLRRNAVASSVFTLSPFFLKGFAGVCHAGSNLTRVYKVQNGAFSQNVSKLLGMMGGIGQFISPTDVVVIKANAQWPNQGYTHTGCIKAVIDAILAIPGFSGEIIICDNIQGGGNAGQTGFDATTSYRYNNWPNENWTSLVQNYYQGQPVSTTQWLNSDIQGSAWNAPTSGLPCFVPWNPAAGEGWGRYFFSVNGRPSFLSCPVFLSPLTGGRLIDLQNGGQVWENGSYTGRRVKAIFMPTLNNHGRGAEDKAGVTSAIKCFFGATEIIGGPEQNCNGTYNDFYHAHGYCLDNFGQTIGTMAGNFINHLYAPALYITAAMYAGSYNRWDATGAVPTNTVLGCTNPVTLDYVACRDVIAPYAPWLNPDNTNNTRQQILACNTLGIGTINPQQFEVVTYDWQNPPIGTRLAVEQKVRDFKAGNATGQDVKGAINQYMEGH